MLRQWMPRSRWLALLILIALAPIVRAGLIQSPADHRQYESFTLPNQMQVLVISDPKTDKAAASLNVQVGSMADPRGREGLAHFLEHMLFLGTKKYPQADAYQQFISANGGSHNAFTADNHTNFFFDVKAQALPQALDRFAQFFIAPLFTPEYVDRERHAVHSEYEAKRRDDGRRLYVASKLAMNPAHPYSHFAVGNLTTLADRPNDPVRKDLVNFYRQHYSANLMSLVVIGRESTAQLRAMVEKQFSAVPNRHLKATASKAPLYQSAKLPQQLDVVTLMQTRQLRLTFPIDPPRQYWQSKPLYYIANEIGYEGKGSLLSRLKALGWAQGLSASTGVDLPNAATFEVGIDLTPEGFQHYRKVVELFFSYVAELRSNGVKQSLYDEDRLSAATQFKFLEPQEPIHQAVQLASAMPYYPMVHLLDAPYRFDHFDPKLIQHFLTQLRPDNLILTRAAPTLTASQTTPRYKIGYTLKPLPTNTLAAWQHPQPDPALEARQPNPFIAKDLSLVPRINAQKTPHEIWHTDDTRLWYQQDQTFNLPKANFHFALITPTANASARNAMLTTLYAEITSDRLNETLYDANLADLDASIYAHLRGISVQIDGYNEPQPRLLGQILKALQQQPSSEERFARIKKALQEDLDNSSKQKPYNQTFNALYSSLLPEWSVAQKQAALQHLTLSDLQQYIPTLFAHARLRIFAYGNLSPASATSMAKQVRTSLLPTNNQPVEAALPVVQLPKNHLLFDTLNIDHNDSALTLYLQGADTHIKTRAEVALLNEILATPFYNQLRTEKQLGYIVFSTYMPLRQVPGLALVVQSPVADPTRLQSEYTHFLDQMQSRLAQLPPAQLELYRQSLISRINKQDNTLSERASRLWRELDRGNTSFDTRARLTRAAQALTKEDLVARLKQLRQRELALRSFGKESKSGARTDDTPALQALKADKRFVPGS